MKITEVLDVQSRGPWRAWLRKNHATAKEIWLVYYRAESGRKRIPYSDAVEEALCYGWIDSTVKKLDRDRFVQRFSPRKKNSGLSEMNKERIRRLIKTGKMTRVGMEGIRHHLTKNLTAAAGTSTLKPFPFPRDILSVLKEDEVVWKNYSRFPAHYRRIRIAWIDGARKRPAEFKKRLRYFVRMTAQNKKFGMIQ